MQADPTLTVILPQAWASATGIRGATSNAFGGKCDDQLSLQEAIVPSVIEIVSRCQQLICFAFTIALTLLQTCREAEDQQLVTLFYFD